MTQAKPPQDPDKPAGQVRHDSSGRAVWEWAAATGRHALESTSRLLKRLDMPDLKLEGDNEPPPDGNRPGGFNPYDRKLPARGSMPTRAAPTAAAAKRPAASAPKAPHAAKPGLLGRLFGRKP